MNTTKTTPRRVDFARHSDDLRVAILGALGLSTRYIESRTSLTPCQISYRLGKAGIRRADYRNGTSDTFHNLHGPIEALAEKVVTKQLRLK